VIRLSLALLLLTGLAVGCSSGGERPHAQRPKPKLRKVVKRGAKSARVYVSVIDGDTHTKVKGAVVRIGSHRDEVGRRGIATLRVKRARPLPVTAWARHYSKRRVRMAFHPHHRWVTLFLFRPTLQWPLYGVTPARTQAQTGIHIRPPFRIAWTRGMGSLIEFPAVVSGGVAFIGNARGIVRAVSMRSGRVAWRTDTNGKMAASPAVVGHEIVTHGMDGRIHVLDRYNGRIVRRFSVGSAIESSPVVRHGIDYFGAWNGEVYAFDLRRGRVKWSYHSGYKITSSAALVGPKVFIGDYGGRLLALSAATGRLSWSGSVNGRIYGTPAVVKGRVFVPSSTGNSLTAFSTGGRRLWSRDTGAYVYSSPAAWGGRVFFGSYNGLLYCLSARSGSTLWTANAGGRISGAAVVVDGIAYAGTGKRIIGVDVRSGKVLVNFAHGEYVPVSGNGQRLLFHGYSRLYALEPRHHRS
jgi:outer membrane protein assembly factor BamB